MGQDVSLRVFRKDFNHPTSALLRLPPTLTSLPALGMGVAARDGSAGVITGMTRPCSKWKATPALELAPPH